MVAMAAGESVADLLGHLDRVSEAGRRAAANVRPSHGPRIPHTEDMFRPSWRPPPAKEDVKRLISDSSRSFARFGKQAGSDFERPCSKRLKPKILDQWTQERKDIPDRTFAKCSSTIRYSAQSEPFPEPHDGLCHGLHQEWLRNHQTARDKHIHAVYHALERVKKAEERLESHEFKRQLARDLLSRPNALVLPEFGSKARSSLGKAKHAIAASRAFSLAANIDRLAVEEAQDKAMVEKAKSAPELRPRPPTPEGQVKHLQRWAGPDHTPKCFRESTPWREHDEAKDLRKRSASRLSGTHA